MVLTIGSPSTDTRPAHANSRFACCRTWMHDLRRRKVRAVPALTHSTLHASWRHLIKRFPTNAGTVRSLERYLTATGVIAADDGGPFVRSAAADAERRVRRLPARRTRLRRLTVLRTIDAPRAAFSITWKLGGISIGSIQPKDMEVISSAKQESVSAGVVSNMRLPPCADCCDSSQQTEGSRPDSTSRSTRRDFIGLSNCLRALPWPTVIELLKIDRHHLRHWFARLRDISPDRHLWLARQRGRRDSRWMTSRGEKVFSASINVRRRRLWNSR